MQRKAKGFGLRLCTVPGSQDDAGGDRWVRGLNLAQQEYCTMLIAALSSVHKVYIMHNVCMCIHLCSLRTSCS